MLDEKIEVNTELVYKKGQCFAVTIAPIDQNQHFNASDRCQKCHNHLQQVFNSMVKRYCKMHKHIEWWFRLELSEPIGKTVTSGPRFHWHGIIHLKDEAGVYIWLCDLMTALLEDGILSIHHITTNRRYEDWERYCLKQFEYLPKQFITVENGALTRPEFKD